MNAFPRKTGTRRFAQALLPCVLALYCNFAFATTPATPVVAPRVQTAQMPTVLTEAQKIQMLIHEIEVLKDARFIRNGSDYDGAAAADHLRLKLRHAGDKIKTAQDFITYLASTSSFSGRPYRIRFADGHEIDSGQFFRSRLAIIEHAPAAVPAAAAPAH